MKKGGEEHSDLYLESYELFRETQHLQPDIGAIQDYLNKKFEAEVSQVCSQVTQHSVTKTKKIRGEGTRRAMQAAWSSEM